MNIITRLERLWALDGFRPDFALSRDESGRFLPWIIALMVYLAALTLTGGITLNRTISASSAIQDNSFSVHLPYKSSLKGDNSDKVLAVLRETTGVTKAEMMDTARIAALVEPWLGKNAGLDNLPIPTIIEVQTDSQLFKDDGSLEKKLKDVAPESKLNNHKEWANQFSDFVSKIQMMLFGVSLLIISTTAGVVVFASKMSLKIHRGTVNLLHRLGAYDSYIAKQFQQHAALLTLKGAFVGSGLAAGTLIILHIMAVSIKSPLFPEFTMSFTHWFILFGLPFFMSGIALVFARISVLRTLMRIP
jgi:cell division transport system permease protein